METNLYIYIHGVHTVVLAGNSPNVRSYTVFIHGSGQPYHASINMQLRCLTHTQTTCWHGILLAIVAAVDHIVTIVA